MIYLQYSTIFYKHQYCNPWLELCSFSKAVLGLTWWILSIETGHIETKAHFWTRYCVARYVKQSLPIQQEPETHDTQGRF